MSLQPSSNMRNYC